MSRAEDTRRRILAAAEEEFARMGLHGARVDEIAHRAEVNKRMLYAYFGNKEQLYAAVLTRVYGRMAQTERSWITLDLPAEETLCEVIRLYFDFLAGDPSFVRMLLWENLNGAACIRATDAGSLKAPALKALTDTVERGIREGVFREDIDPGSTAQSVNMCCFSYFSNIHTMSHLMARDLTDPAAIAAYSRHITEMILRFLKK
jgi:TetR/AcrR family transcriptional regulator